MARGGTIAAIATGQAPGGIGVVRISGPQARAVGDRVFRSVGGRALAGMRGYTAAFGGVFSPDGEKLDDAVALVFAAPKSYTGEDVVELSCHGGLVVTRRVLRAVLDAGAAPAGPGEFTRRAFLNGKMDLAQAEAVMGLISASGEQAARAALAASGGALSKRVGALREELAQLAAHLAAWADFPDEDVPAVDSGGLDQSLAQTEAGLARLLAGFEAGRALREGVETVIAGRPNVGKSTLMNLLAGRPRSIVTDLPGTTRDVVEETVTLAGVPLRLADTAGLRATDDPVESLGVAAARRRLETAQLVLAVFDASQPLTPEDEGWLALLDPARTVAVVNKTDLPPALDTGALAARFPRIAALSAAQGQGLEGLERQVADLLGTAAFQPEAGELFTQRQRADASAALEAVRQARQALADGMTLDAVTVWVEEALGALSALTGQRVSDEIVDRVFEEFCVGK